MLNHNDCTPSYVLITEARRSDIKMADAFPLNPGSIVTMDRGYSDYALFGRWTERKIHFVTRLKENAAYEVLNKAALPANRDIRFDQLMGTCKLPVFPVAQACSLNAPVVPRGPLGYLTMRPSGAAQPVVSTLDAPDGQALANAEIVKAGFNGSIDVFATNTTQVIIDTNGFFGP